MRDTFYISYNETWKWYMLLTKDTHFCLASGDTLEKVLKSLTNYVMRYRTKDRLFNAINSMECKGLTPPKVLEVRRAYYTEHGEDYAGVVEDTVLDAIRQAREYDVANSPLTKTKKRLKKSGVEKSLKRKTKVLKKVDRTPEDTPQVISRPKILPRRALLV